MNNGLRELLEQLSTKQLDEMLQAELQKRPMDPEAVKMIMRILEEREEPVVLTPEIQVAWKNFKKRDKASNNRRSWIGPLLRVASVILILALLFVAMPQKAGAQSLWDRLLYVTESFFEFLNPSDANDHRVGYEFKTDNQGLQKVYDAVVEMGITEPVVPMWIPKGYELTELKKDTNKVKAEISAVFMNSGYYLVYKIDKYKECATHDYYMDGVHIKEYEAAGVTHNVLQNNERFVAVWNRDNVECFLTLECQEDVLYKILNSIYVMGDE